MKTNQTKSRTTSLSEKSTNPAQNQRGKPVEQPKEDFPFNSAPMDEVFKELNILPFDLQIKHKQACFMWKLSKNLIHPPLSNLFTRNEHNPLKYNLPRTQNDYSRRAVTYSGIKIWNTELTTSHRNITSLKLFNDTYKKYLINTL